MTVDRQPAEWWPLSLSPALLSAFWKFRERMNSSPSLDHARLEKTSHELDLLMHTCIGNIMERDGLPHLCHIINGWGNGQYNNIHHTDRIAGFIHKDSAQHSFLLQKDPEGDFHPWQTFAYAVMAGVPPEQTIGRSAVTLKELATHSTYLKTDKGTELGHLLYAFSHIIPEETNIGFSLNGQCYDLQGLLDLAIDAHIRGDFEVCRKFHLTEGICALAKKVAGLEAYHDMAMTFLKGQLEMLFLLGMIFEQLNSDHPDKILLDEVRKSLVLGDAVENHAYYAGHAIELATLAALMGFPIDKVYWNAMVYITNSLNAIIPAFTSRIAFEECFLHFGHYRRAVTLLAELEKIDFVVEKAATDILTRYTVSFNGSLAQLPAPGNGNQYDGLFSFAVPTRQPRPRFEQVVEIYNSSADPLFKTKGTFDHFRRICPPNWPRFVHYEFLDYKTHIGVEIHLEHAGVAPLKENIQSFKTSLEESFPGKLVGWDELWYNKSGRLALIFNEADAAEEVAQSMQAFIDLTFPRLNEKATALTLDL
jgi:hypothetical protein